MNTVISFIKTHLLYLLRLICRYYIAYNMFSYAFGKILKSQFDLGVTTTIDENISNFNGFMLTWYYYGYSRAYGLVIATTQIVAGLLLLFRKTERLGVVLFLSFMVNILLVDIFYEIDGALWHAAKLTALGVFLLLSDWQGFKTYFLKVLEQVRTIPQIIPEKFHKVYWIKFLIIPFMIYYTYQDTASMKAQYLSPNELYGIWRNVSGYRSDRIHKISFGYRNDIKIRDFDDKPYYGRMVLDTAVASVTINANHYGDGLRYFIKDSVQKLPDHKKNDTIKNAIKEYYHRLNASPPFKEQKFSYQLRSDTLILKKDDKLLYFINSTKDYIPDYQPKN